jgi:DNA replication initiation complex subunit (GINS family)
MTDEEQQMLKEVEELIENEQKYEHLLKVLKSYAEAKHCYDREGDDYTPSRDSYDTAFDDGAEFGEVLFARTLLEQIGVEFEYPCMSEDK